MVRQLFDKIAHKYDSNRPTLIPCFYDLYGSAIDLAQFYFKNQTNLNILDLGAGTGLFSDFLFATFPNSHFTLLDFSSKMLKVAKERFQDEEKFLFVESDICKHEFKASYDLIVSSMAMHHLNNENKKLLIDKIFSSLNKNGIFILADQFRGENEGIEKFYIQYWNQKIKESGISETSLKETMKRVELDIRYPLSEHIKWMKKSGFSDISTYYQYYQFAVIAGRKA